MSNGELNIAIIGLLCLVGLLAVAVETRLYRRRLRAKGGTDARGGGSGAMPHDSRIPAR